MSYEIVYNGVVPIDVHSKILFFLLTNAIHLRLANPMVSSNIQMWFTSFQFVQNFFFLFQAQKLPRSFDDYAIASNYETDKYTVANGSRRRKGAT